MTITSTTSREAEFIAPLIQNTGPGGWTYAVMPDSGEFFGTRRPVRVAGTLDGHAFEATLLPMGDGTHMVPVKAALRKVVGKGGGDAVTVRLHRREV